MPKLFTTVNCSCGAMIGQFCADGLTNNVHSGVYVKCIHCGSIGFISNQALVYKTGVKCDSLTLYPTKENPDLVG